MPTRRWLSVMVVLCVLVAGCNSDRVPTDQAQTDDADVPVAEVAPVETPAAPTGFTADQIRSADDMPALRAAAQVGDANAMFLLGREHFIGRYMPRNMEAARKWFEQSSQAGSVADTNALGVIYYEALGVDPDYDRARVLFLTAAELGNAKAMRNIGRMYEGGHGVEVDNAEALRWYEAALKSAGTDEHLKAVLAEMIANVKAAEAQP